MEKKVVCMLSEMHILWAHTLWARQALQILVFRNKNRLYIFHLFYFFKLELNCLLLSGQNARMVMYMYNLMQYVMWQ